MMKHVNRLVAMLLTLCLAMGAGLAPHAVAATSGHPFKDLQGSPYEQFAATLWEYGVVNGVAPDTFAPTGPVTRSQMAAFIVRALGKAQDAELLKDVKNEFTDVPNDHWARGVITLAHRAEIIKGDAGRFYPNDPVNYAQAVTMLVRALGYESQVVGGFPSGYVTKANDLGLVRDVTTFELYGGVSRGAATILLYNAIFRAPSAKNGLTLSQSVFKRAVTLSIANLPPYVAPGQQLAVNATANDAEGKPIPDAAIQLRVTAGSGQIQSNILTVGDGGPVTVAASLGDLSATATITPVSKLTITPDAFQATKGGTIQLTATALSGGLQVPVQPEWKVTGPGSITQQGLLTVTDYGSVTVEAVLGSLKATAAGQAVGRVSITQKPAAVVPGLPYTLTAAATDTAGRAINVPITWSAVGGTIERETGRLTNAFGSQVVVKATAAGMSDEVTIPVITSIAVTPADATILRGRTVLFTAKGVDSSGAEHAVDVRWDRNNAAVGVLGADGTFAATGSGSATVTATLGSLVGRSTVTVGGDPARLSIASANTTLPAGTGATTTITVRLLDAGGALSPVTDQPVSLTMTDSGNGKLSRTVALTRDGQATVTYTAGSTAGIANIAVSAPGTTMTNQLTTITTYRSTPSYVQLSASPQPLATGGGIAEIKATLMDNNNYPAIAAQTTYVTLTASGTFGGGLTGTTVTIPVGQSSGTTSYISSGTPGSVQINGTGSGSIAVRGVTLQTAAVGAAAKVKIQPVGGPTPITGLSSLLVQVEVLDAANVRRANDSATNVQLTVAMDNANAGTQAFTYTASVAAGVATFQVPAYAVGTATLTASLVGGNSTDTAKAEFVPGVFSSLKLTASPATVAADGFSQTQVVAEVVDGAGTVLTSVNPVVTFRKVVDNGSTIGLTSTSVQAVGGRAVLTLQSTQVAGTDTWYASAVGLETQNLATVTTTASSGNAYTLRVSGATSYAVNTANTLLVQVVDQNGNVVTTDNSRVITASVNVAGASMNPTSAVTRNGVATFVIIGSQAAAGTVIFSTTNLAVPYVQSNVSFGTNTGNPGGNAYSLFASADVTTTRYGNTVTVRVRVMDNQGNVVSTDNNRSVSMVISGNAVPSANTALTSGGIATFSVTGVNTGPVTLTFTGQGLPQPTAGLTLTFTN